MSNPGEASAGGSGKAPASADSPKPHGDKLASAGQAAAGGGRPGEEAGGPGGECPPGDSPKPHGDKLAGAGRAAATPAAQAAGPGRGGR